MFPIVVFLLQGDPAFVLAKHLFAEFVPGVFFGFETNPIVGADGGLQILHADNPIRPAFSIVNAEETFFTILQFDRWYFCPDGVL